MHMTPFLKRVLALDSLSCLAMSAGLLLATGPLSGLLGLPRGLVVGAGLVLLPVGVFILWLATRPPAARLLVQAVIAGNLLWVAESLVVAERTDGITAAGLLFVLGQAAAVAAITVLEFAGSMRAPRATADAAEA